MKTDDSGNPLPALVDRLGKVLAFAASRLLLFFSSLAAAAIVCVSASRAPGLPPPSLTALFFTAFFGVFLLFPARRPVRMEDAAPLLGGLGLCLVWTFLGLPWQYTPIWGAAAAFLTRVFIARGHPGLEWAALPFLLAGIFSYYAGLHGTAALPAPVWSLPLFSLAAWLPVEAARLRQKRLQAAEARSREPDPALAAKLEVHRRSARRLEEKAASMPPGVRDRVRGIAGGAHDIIRTMTEDAGDAAAGDRFLRRYLTAALGVVEEYLRLGREGGADPEIVAALVRAEQSLTALDRAFADERVRLLRNDTMSFRAELAALDKLLKMDGKNV